MIFVSIIFLPTHVPFAKHITVVIVAVSKAIGDKGIKFAVTSIQAMVKKKTSSVNIYVQIKYLFEKFSACFA